MPEMQALVLTQLHIMVHTHTHARTHTHRLKLNTLAHLLDLTVPEVQALALRSPT